MSEIYFIGGAPRSGKSTAIQKLIEQKPMLAASSDAIRSVAKSVLRPEQNPTLFKTGRGALDSKRNVAAMLETPESVLSYEIGESVETWKSVLDFISYYQRDGRDAAIEGVAVIPSLLNKLPFEFSAVFIVNLNDQTDVILEHARSNKNDWLGKYDTATIRAFCHFNQVLNRYYADEASRYGYSVVEVSQDRFDENIEEAVRLLLYR